MREREATLPSGLKVKLRAPGPLAYYRVQGAIPALGDSSKDEKTQVGIGMGASIKLVIETMVEPKVWADLRSDEERSKSPMEPPKGYREIDDVFDWRDYQAVLKEIDALVAGLKEEVGPLSEAVQTSG